MPIAITNQKYNEKVVIILKKFSKLLSILLSALLLLSICVVPAAATEEDSSAAATEEDVAVDRLALADRPTGAQERITVSLDESDLEWFVLSSSMFSLPEEKLVSEWDLSTHFGYNYLGKLENGKIMQDAYMSLYSVNEQFMDSYDDVTTTEIAGEERYVYGIVYDESFENLSYNELYEVYFTFINDFPQFFWMSNQVLAGGGAIFTLVYDEFANGEIRQNYKAAFESSANKIITEASKLGSNYEKALYVHDAVCRMTSYAYEADGATPLSSGITHSIIGALCEEMSVCDGYAKAFQYIMNRIGVDCLLITGYSGGEHAWNMVKMDDGKYYFIDLTWDDLDDGRIDIYYAYFLTGIDEFLTTHIPYSPFNMTDNFVSYLPESSNGDTFTFYEKQNMSVDSYSLESYSAALRSSFEYLVSNPENQIGYLKFDESISASNINRMLSYVTYYISMLESADGYYYNASFSYVGNVYFYALTKSDILNDREYGVTLLDDGVNVGRFKTLSGAIESMKSDGSVYTVRPSRYADLYPYTKFPEKCSIVFDGSRYPADKNSYYYSTIYIYSDINANCNLSFDEITMIGQGSLDKSEPFGIFYSKNLKSTDNIILSDVYFEYVKIDVSGDISGDNQLTSQDLLLFQQHMLNKTKFDQTASSFADVNKDNIIDSADMLIIQIMILQS